MNKSKKLKIIIPISILLIVFVVVLALILIPKEISQQNYFHSLTSNYTKQIQNTTITEGDVLVYEKIETMVFDEDKIYHKVQEKSISASPNVLYDEIVAEYYYTSNKMYYKQNDVWLYQDFDIKSKLKTYNLKDEYFKTFEFDKEFDTLGEFKGNIKDQNVNDVFNSETNFTNVCISIVVNKNMQVQTCNITAKTQASRDVVINNTFSYNSQSVILPN